MKSVNRTFTHGYRVEFNCEVNFIPPDGKPYTILSYANGPGAKQTYNGDGTRRDLSNIHFGNRFYKPSE